MGLTMDARGHPNRILELELSGKFAHFRKFYTNASSLTFTIPPRTVVAGLIASVLKYPRDSYYDVLSSDHLFVAVAVKRGVQPRKFMQTLNYIKDNSKQNPINDASVHSQCRFELLTGSDDKDISYRIWLGFHTQNEKLASLEKLITDRNFGYGIYLGQRQFRADLKIVNRYDESEFEMVSESAYVDSAIALGKAKPNLDEQGVLQIERMPLEQIQDTIRKVQVRRLTRAEEILFHISGQRIEGSFKDCCKIRNDQEEVIYFL
jgi:CRISPR-associated protein Cas5h